MKPTLRRLGVSALLAVAAPGVSTTSQAADWAAAPARNITLFYPAQLSWEVLLVQAQHTGANRFKRDRTCRDCHEGEEAASGKLLVGEKTMEPTPIAGKPGAVGAVVKMAHDAENLYVRLEFALGAQPDARMDRKFEAKVALMFSGPDIAEFVRGGCYAACHIDSASMPLGEGNGDRTMYLPASRGMITRAGGDRIRPDDQLAALRTQGKYAEYWQAGLNAGASPGVVAGSVLEKREEYPNPAVSATASLDKGKWVVTFKRKLKAGARYQDIVPGRIYTVGFSIHAGHTNRRFHYVSLENTFGIDALLSDIPVVPVDITKDGPR